MLKKWLCLLCCLYSTAIFAQQAAAPVFSLHAANIADSIPKNLFFVGPYLGSYHAVYDKQYPQTLRVTITDSIPMSPGLMIIQKVPLPVSAGGKLSLRIQVKGQGRQQVPVQLSCAILNKKATIVKRLTTVSSYTNGWHTLTLQGNIPPEAEYIAPTVQIDGPGELLLSEMTATMNGKPLHLWLDQQYIAGATASNLHLQPFTPLGFGDTMIAGHPPRILAIGEYCHGSSENIRAYTAIAKHVLERCAYNTVTLEVGMDVAMHIDRYVLGYTGEDIHGLLKFSGWHMNTQEILDFINWIKSYNESHPSAIRVMGMDMQLPILAINELVADSSLGAPMMAAVTRIAELAEDMLSGTKVDTAVLRTVRNNFQQLVATAKTDNGTLFKMHQLAQFLELFSREQRVNWGSPHNFEQGGFRDSCMAVNVRNWLQDTTIRTVLIGHNTHLMKLSGLAGGYLQKYFGKDYVMVMSLIGAGNYFYGWDAAVQQPITLDLPAMPIGSLEYNIFHNSTQPGWLSLDAPVFKNRYRYNMLGMGQNAAANYTWNLVPEKVADYMIYLPKTTPAAVFH